MLVLNRKEKEIIDIIDRNTGKSICELVVVEIRPGQVRLGLHSPKHILILRREVENAEAVSGEVR